MNFVRDVVEIVGENDVANARASLKKMLKELKVQQNGTRKYIEDNYEDYVSSQVGNIDYLDQAERLCTEVNDLLQNIENETKHDLVAITEDVQQYLGEIRELSIGLIVSKRILKIDRLLNELEEAKRNIEFIHIRRLINEMKNVINDAEHEDIFKKLDCYKNIKIRWHVENESLLNTLQTRFDELVQLNEKTFQNTKVVTLKINHGDETLRDIMSMLFNSNFNIQRVCLFLMDNIFEPIIMKPVVLQCNPNNAELQLSFSLKPIVVQAENLNLRPSYKEVFGRIRTVFGCLSHLNIVYSDELSVFSIIAKNIKEQFCKLLINDCLTYAIPDTMDDMNASTLAQDIVDFHTFLQSISILNTDAGDQKLVEFAERVDVIFRKRFCLNIQKNAVQIMHRPLFDMQMVDDKLTGGTFPNCLVSRNTFELIELMENVLKEASESNNLRASTNGAIDNYVIDDIHNRLGSTIPMILERYLTEVVSVHAKILQTIPQQTALFHNNCLYLAWWYGKQSNAASATARNTSIVSELQELGSKQFGAQIKNQRSQLLNILKEFDLTDCVTELSSQPIKAVRQCLRQLDLLQNVWQGVLPEIVYNKSMGTIVNDICVEVTHKIISMEDISSSVANSLVEICDEIFERTPSVFDDPLEVSVNVKQWQKLQQLKMILNASLAHITEQWADGKGPLTLHYKAEEVRHLIRALFQNTDRRANALATII